MPLKQFRPTCGNMMGSSLGNHRSSNCITRVSRILRQRSDAITNAPTEDLGGNPPQKTTTIGRAKDKGSQNGQAKDEAGRTHTKTEARRRPPETDSRLQSEHVS